MAEGADLRDGLEGYRLWKRGPEFLFAAVFLLPAMKPLDVSEVDGVLIWEHVADL